MPDSFDEVRTMEWTDERMDDLAGRMDAGFARVDRDIRDLRGEMHAEFRDVRGEMHAGFRDLRGEIAGLRTVMTRFGIAMIVSLIGVIAALVGVVVTGA